MDRVLASGARRGSSTLPGDAKFCEAKFDPEEAVVGQ